MESGQDAATAAKPVIEIYGSQTCGYCGAARMLLKRKGLDYQDILVTNDEKALADMLRKGKGRSVPQIIINGQGIGGFDELHALEQSGELDRILATP